MWNTPWPEPWTMCFLLPLYSYPPSKFFLVVFAAEEYIYDHSGCDVNADAWHGWKVVFRYFVEGCNVGLMKGSKKDKLRKSVTISIKGTIWHPSVKQILMLSCGLKMFVLANSLFHDEACIVPNYWKYKKLLMKETNLDKCPLKHLFLVSSSWFNNFEALLWLFNGQVILSYVSGCR